MSSRKTLYYPIESFSEYLRLIKNEKESFEVTSTTYTKKIKMDEYTIMFNNEGKPDFNMLCLINKVRKDAKKFIGLPSEDRIDFFDMIQRPDMSRLITKVDLKSAYWIHALQLGVITDDTNQFFVKKWGEESRKKQKNIRLKALGSLATTSVKTIYKDGKRIDEPEKVTTQQTKKTYMEVCRGIDNIMKDCANSVDGCIYYYVDCMFVDSEFDSEVIEYFKSKKFEVGTEHTKLEYIPINGTGYVCSQADDIMYVTREEDKNLLPNIESERWI